MSGSTDVIGGPSAQDYRRLTAEGGDISGASKSAPGATMMLMHNCAKAPFDDIEFRRAVARAFDRAAIAERIHGGLMEETSALVGIGIIIEASLSFVGLGVKPPTPSWGAMLTDIKQTVFTGEYRLSLFPGRAIILSVIGFNLLDDALRDVFDPKRRDRTVGGIA